MPFLLTMTTLSIKKSVENDLDKALMSSKVLLQNFSVINDESRKSLAYLNYRYFPLYYHLGKYIQPKSFVEIGIQLALASGCFFKSCKTVEHYLGFQEQRSDFYSPRIAARNLSSVFKKKIDIAVGKVFDDSFQKVLTSRNWDLVIINDETGYDQHRNYLEMAWRQMSLDALLVVEYVGFHKPSTDAFEHFCKSVGREPVRIKSRFGTGLIQK